MVEVARHVECASSREFEVAFGGEASLLLAACIVGQGVGGAVAEDDFDALAALQVDGSPSGGGERHAVEFHGHLIVSRNGEGTS